MCGKNVRFELAIHIYLVVDPSRSLQNGYNLIRLPCNPSVIFCNLCNL